MKRIYQGRVTQIEAENFDGNFNPVAFGRDQSTCPLWKHHSVFQDAVNYYLLALASMAKEPVQNADRLMSDLPKRIAESWEIFPKPDAARAGAKSLRDSVAPWIGLDGSATLERAASAILEGNMSEGRTLSYALALILHECSGDSGIQQGGRAYLPKLCDAECRASYSFSASSRTAEEGKDKLAAVLHGDSTEAQLEAIASEMELSWTVKVDPDQFHKGEMAFKRLNEALNYLEGMIKEPTPRLKEALRGIPDPLEQLAKMRERINLLPEGFRIQKNRKAAPPLTFSSIAFMTFPSRLTAACLRIGVKAPAKTATPRQKTGVDFGFLGDDPVKLARGERGYVFRAFTALPRWKPDNPGNPAWKEFDIAAFKEALKNLNQFRLKTDERGQKKKNLEGLIAYLLGTSVRGWKHSTAEDGEEAEPPTPMNTDLLQIGWELEEEMTRGLSESIVGTVSLLPFGDTQIPYREGGWTVTNASLRGLREILPDWKRLVAKHGPEVPPSKLVAVVKEYQAREGKAEAIGSVGLFLTLCEPRFRPLWMDAPHEQGDECNRFLQRLADLHEYVADYIRCGEAIKLTPAEPRHSRRLFMFERSAVRYSGINTVDVSMATLEDCASQQRFRLTFAAPRLRRDGLLGSESGWMQPVTRALGLEMESTNFGPFDSAFSLMPDFNDSGSLRFLLNFTASIDVEPIRKALGKNAIWERQFNGTKDKHIHLHWPGTVDTEKMKVTPWWQNPSVLERGFTILATDLGQRTVGAWALVRVTPSKPDSPRPVRSVGHIGKLEWFGEVLKTGIYRLPGENVMVRDKVGAMREELSGKRGRIGSEEEWREALELAKGLLAEEPANWVGAEPSQKSFPEQNDSLIVLANRRLSRLGTFHRWSCFAPEKESDPLKKASLIEKLSAELAQWQNEEVREWATKLTSESLVGFRDAASTAFTTYRASLLPVLLKIANRVAPLRNHRWEWHSQRNGTPYGELLRGPRDPGDKPLVRGQRGLSLARIEQMENLRRLFLRFNRALDREAGRPAKFGRADTGRASGEPCRDLLAKIDRLKEQRVNQTAHLILAQALGVRLSPHTLDFDARQEGDHHGEYTQIPDRLPVDLVVLEDLSRYLSSQGRSPSENSRLMKWAHRAIRDKVKMLIEEPFGIPVLEVPAAYSSRFSAITGEPGSRCEERAELDDYLKEALKRRSVTPPVSGQPDQRDENSQLLKQFETLDAINARRRATGQEIPATLLLPKTGGPLFLGAKVSPVVQSDINAAINLAFRAIAAPEALHLLHRVRAESRDGKTSTAAKNARERAAYGNTGVPISIEGTLSARLSTSPNFFFDVNNIATFDKGKVPLGEASVTVASGIGLWRAVNEMILPRILRINAQRLCKLKASESLNDPKDQIPM